MVFLSTKIRDTNASKKQQQGKRLIIEILLRLPEKFGLISRFKLIKFDDINFPPKFSTQWKYEKLNEQGKRGSSHRLISYLYWILITNEGMGFSALV